MRSVLIFSCILISGVFIVSCAPSKSLSSLQLLSAEDILHRVEERNRSITSLEAEGTLTIETPENSGSASFELQWKRPDSLWMEFTGPFGISLGRLQLSRERFVSYNTAENLRMSGRPDAKALESVFRVALSYDDAFEVFSGSFRGFVSAGANQNVSVVDGQYSLESPTAYGRKRLLVDGETFITTGITEFGADGRPIVIGTALRIEPVDGTSMPHLVRIIFPKQRRSLTMAYSTVRINGEFQKKFSFPDEPDAVSNDSTR